MNKIDIPPIKVPKNRKKINIFADFETFLFADGYPLWEHKNEEGFGTLLAAKCEVIPWLLGAYIPFIDSENGKTKV